ncbi:MAG TPA: LLM class flavin-dependent oxidoreductase [Anaerolineaceae bacterium]|nr:LLM class flavin-dependent oxidoreductase [Anaerolineaceae bacterium]
MDHLLHFGINIPADLRDPALRATYTRDINRLLDRAEGHFQSAWIIDHLQFDGIDVLESFTTLSYLAALHPRLQFGHTVICQSFRNPALLAKMIATLQLLTGGRYILGIGAGGHEEEHRAYGYDFPSGQVRVDQLEETLQILRLLWTRNQATFEGKYHRILSASCEPKPDRLPPIMIGAFRPKMLQLTARYADCWNASSTGIAIFCRMSAALDRYCAEIGRDPSTLRRTWGGGFFCAATEDKALALAKGRYDPGSADEFDFLGTPDQVIAQMQPFIEAGVDTLILDPGGFPKFTALVLLIREVIPAL